MYLVWRSKVTIYATVGELELSSSCIPKSGNSFNINNEIINFHI